MTDTGFTVLVNSSDGFEDCWSPFFVLFRKYWPEFDGKILLNTENKQYKAPGLNAICTQVQPMGEPRYTWSECLMAALKQVPTPLVLYMQEDYFLHRPVINSLVQAAANYMLDHSEVKHIALTNIGSLGPYLPYQPDWLQIIKPTARYRVSTQAALWRVETLQSYLVPEENGWMFEIYGTWRARRRNELFLRVRSCSSADAPFEYLHTGIIKGKWLSDIQRVFVENNIEVDFSKRGFYVPKHPLLRRLETGMRLLENPAYFIRQLF